MESGSGWVPEKLMMVVPVGHAKVSDLEKGLLGE